MVNYTQYSIQHPHNIVSAKHLVVIVGPTAVGKTSLSVQLAEKLHTEIISADARQFYRDIPIGTAQPTKEEMRSIPHHFLSFLSIQQNYTAGHFEKEALQILENLFVYHDVVILTGGSGLYIKALCEGLVEVPTISPNMRALLNATLVREGLPYLTQLLAQKDPHYHDIVDLKNPKRVIRALEITLTTGIPYSTFRQKSSGKARNFQLIKVGLFQEKTCLHKQIELRVDAMMTQGLRQEAKKLYPYKATNALQTIGYKELFDYMDKKYTLEEAVNHIKANTKKYAKKQMTWFKKDKNINWFTPYELAKIGNYIAYMMQKPISPISAI